MNEAIIRNWCCPRVGKACRRGRIRLGSGPAKTNPEGDFEERMVISRSQRASSQDLGLSLDSPWSPLNLECLQTYYYYPSD